MNWKLAILTACLFGIFTQACWNSETNDSDDTDSDVDSDIDSDTDSDTDTDTDTDSNSDSDTETDSDTVSDISCEEAGGMCVDGTTSEDCPNGMGTTEASSNYYCAESSEQCCVPIDWECHVPPDCFFMAWDIWTQGHFDCIDNKCEKISDFCDDPPEPPCCGDDTCDDWYGENDESCTNDCA